MQPSYIKIHLSNRSSAVSSCHNRVYQSLANLIRWSDQVMLEGIDLDDKDTVANRHHGDQSCAGWCEGEGMRSAFVTRLKQHRHIYNPGVCL